MPDGKIPKLFGAACRVLIGLFCLAAAPGCGTTGEARPPAPPEVAERTAEAKALLARGDVAPARVIFEDLAARFPFAVEPHRQLQNIGLEEHRSEELVERYRRFLADHPDSPEANYLLGRLAHHARVQEGYFDRAIAQNPQFAWGLYGKSFSVERLGRAEEALAYANRALDDSATVAPAQFMRGRLLVAAGRLDEAEAAFDAAIEADPTMSDALVFRATTAAARGKTLDRWIALERALRVRPTDSAIAAAAAIAGNPDDPAADPALETLEALEARGTRSAATAAALASVYERRGDLEKASAAARRAIEGRVSDRDVIGVLRRSLVRRGDVHGALAAWIRWLGVPENELAAPIRAVLRQSPSWPVGDVTTWPLTARLDAAELLERAGWNEEAWIVLRDASGDPRTASSAAVDGPVLERLSRVAREIGAHRRLLRTLVLLEREVEGVATNPLGADLELFLAAVADRVHAETGVVANSGNRVLRFPFIGEMLAMDGPLPESLNAYFRTHNQVLLAGRLAGGRAGMLVMTLATDPTPRAVPGFDAAVRATEFMGADVVVRPNEDLFREIGGRALYGCIYLDLDVLAPWRDELFRRALVDDATRTRLMAAPGVTVGDPAERTSLDFPGDVELTLILRQIEDSGTVPLIESVRTHELGHVADAEKYIPFFDKLFENLALGFEGGFTSRGVMSALEEHAQLFALRHGEAPYLVLSELVRALPAGGDPGPHAAAYGRLLKRFVEEIDKRSDEFPAIRGDRMLLHQLHRLSADEIKRIANAL